MKFKTAHLKRYREIAGLFWKYGRADFGEKVDATVAAASAEAGEPGYVDTPHFSRAAESEVKRAARTVSPEQLVDDLEAMGPTYVKLGQVLAGRPDLLPDTYRQALARLQDKVKPFPYEEVEKIVEQQLGVRISKAFSEFDPEPIAAASLGQVHGARLRDGRSVVVKIQRPEILGQITQDFEILTGLATTLDAHTKVGRRYRFGRMIEEFHLTLQNELNYELEAQNLITLGQNLRDFAKIQVPQPVMDYTTRTVLTMERVTGRKITSLSPFTRLEVDGAELCDELFRAYLKQVLVDGIFHADPHPGNVFLTDENRIALLDLGMVGHTAPQMQENLLKLLLAISDGNSDAVADLVVRVGERTDDFRSGEFRRKIAQLVAQTRDKGLAQVKVGESILQVVKNAGENGVVVPGELTLLGKTLLQLDEIGRILAPDWDPNASVRRNVDEFMTQRMKKDATKGNLLSSALEMKEFVGGLPSRLNRIMDSVANNDLEVKVKAVDAKVVMQGMQKIANRITTGLVLAALIIGAALLMRVPTAFRLFGYPGLAMLCFLAAAIGGFWLVIDIVVQDYHDKKKIKEQSGR